MFCGMRKVLGIKFSKIVLIMRTNFRQMTHKFHSTFGHPSSSAFVNGKGQTGLLLLSGVFWDYRDKAAMTAKTLRPLSAPFSLHLKN